MINILVTGANGYVGKSLVKTLQANYNVIEIRNDSEYSVHENVYCMNLLDAHHIGLFLDANLCIDIIVHTASKMASSENVKDFTLLHDNLRMYEHLVQIAEKLQAKKVINFSSIALYPNQDGEYSENSQVNPSPNSDVLYGLSKFCGENILDSMLKSSSTKITHMRISQIFSDDLREDRLYSVMKKELLESNKITVYGNGERVSNFIHKDLLLQKVLFFIKNEHEGVFNIGDKNFSYKEFAEYVRNIFGNQNSEIILKPEGLKSKCYINVDKFNSLEI